MNPKPFTPDEYETVTQRAPIGIAKVDRDGVMVWVNATFCELLGYGFHELVGKTFAFITASPDEKPDLDEFDRLMKGDQPADQYWLRPKSYNKRDGTLLKANLKAIAFRENGEITYACGYVTPVDDDRQVVEDVIRVLDARRVNVNVETANIGKQADGTLDWVISRKEKLIAAGLVVVSVLAAIFAAAYIAVTQTLGSGGGTP